MPTLSAYTNKTRAVQGCFYLTSTVRVFCFLKLFITYIVTIIESHKCEIVLNLRILVLQARMDNDKIPLTKGNRGKLSNKNPMEKG